MFIFWGTGRKKKVTKYSVNDLCGRCGTATRMPIVQVYNYGHIFFIPICKVGTKYFVECPHCKAARQLTKEEFNAIKEQNLVENGKEIKPHKTPAEVKPVVNAAVQAQPLQVQAEPQVAAAPAQEDQESVMEKLIWADIDKVIFSLVDKSIIQDSDRFAKFLGSLKASLLRKYGDEKRVSKVVNKYFEL